MNLESDHRFVLLSHKPLPILRKRKYSIPVSKLTLVVCSGVWNTAVFRLALKGANSSFNQRAPVSSALRFNTYARITSTSSVLSHCLNEGMPTFE